MEPSQASQLARSLMNDHGLHDWLFQLDHSKVRFGHCRQRSKVISLSQYLIRLNDEAQVKDTVLHEIAHALVGPGHGHDAEWKQMAKDIGARPERLYGETVETPDYKWLGTCKCPGLVFRRHRRIKQGRCKRCKSLVCWRLNQEDYQQEEPCPHQP